MCKKWIAASRGTRIFLTFLYVSILLAMPLDHTCNLSNHKESDWHADSVNHVHEITYGPENKTVFGGISSEKTLQTNNQYCAACFYTLLAKSHGTSIELLPIAIDARPFIKILPQLDFIAQSQHLSSVSLRAPPSFIS